MKLIRLGLCMVLVVGIFVGCKSVVDVNEKEQGMQKEDVIKDDEIKDDETGGDDTVENNDGIMNAEIPYTLYQKPPVGWVGDTMPMTDANGVQIYYLQDWRDGAEGFHPIHKFSTKNFVDYSYDGEMVSLGISSEPDLAIGTGSIILVDGVYHCFYTGHNYKFPNLGKNKESVMHAISTDNVNWTKIPEDTFLAPEGYEIHDFRDPFVFFNEEEELYWMLMSARKEGVGGVVAKFVSKDLKVWEVDEPLYAPNSYFMLECADLFKMGDYWYMIFSEFSHDKVTRYVMSKDINGPFYAPEHDIFDGNAFYAAKSTEYEGKRYLVGWIPTKPDEKDSSKYEWAGNMSVVELKQEEDGTLSALMPEQFYSYFDTDSGLSVIEESGDVKVEGDTITFGANEEISYVDFGTIPDTMLVTAQVTFHQGGRGAGFSLGVEEDFLKGFGIHLDPKEHLLRYDAAMLERIRYANPNSKVHFSFDEGTTYDLKLVIEKDIAVLYMNDKVALSTRIYRMNENKWGLFNIGGEVTFSNIEIKLPSKE